MDFNISRVISSNPSVIIPNTSSATGQVQDTSAKIDTREIFHRGTGYVEHLEMKPSVFSLKQGEAYSGVLRNDEYEFHDGHDSSRDISGVYSYEGKPDDSYKFRVDLTRLRMGSEIGNLDVYTLISLGKPEGQTKLPDDIPGVTSQPWNIAIGAYDNSNFKAIDEKGNPIANATTGVRFNALNNSVEFNLNKNVLREMGWKDGQPLRLQTFTAKDYVKQVADSLDEPTKKPWATGKMSRYVDTAKPEFIQSPRDDNWAGNSIYFVLTDRFEDGDKANNVDVEKSDLRKYQGGDLQGLINKMDYIKDLGATTLWLTPVMSGQTDFCNSAGYHGYWPVDFFSVDKHLGDMSKFKELVQVAHDKGIKVVLDIPLNHVAWEHPFKNDPSKKDWFHQIGDIQNWNDPYQVENGSMYGLPDLAQEKQEVYNYLLDVCKFWIKEGNIDGFRLDAVSHVPKWFWDKLSADVKQFAGPDFFLLGEVVHGDPGKLAGFQSSGMTSLFDMPLYYGIRDTIAYDGSTKALAGKINELESRYENPQLMSSVIDNHDTDRFATLCGNNGREKTKLALALITTLNRIPTIYYGTEAGMTGRLEKMGVCGPENRDNMKFNADPEMETFVKTLLNTRNHSAALREGAYLETWQDDQILGYTRVHPFGEAMVFLNNSYDSQYREVPLRKESKLTDGTVLRDVLSGQEITVTDGKVKLNLARKQPMVLVPVKEMETWKEADKQETAAGK